MYVAYCNLNQDLCISDFRVSQRNAYIIVKLPELSQNSLNKLIFNTYTNIYSILNFICFLRESL